MAGATEATTVIYSGDLHADALMGEFANWNYLTRDVAPVPNNLRYTFTLSSDVGAAAPDGSPTPFNSTQQAAARAILAHASRVTGIVFTETASAASADVHFANADLVGGSTSGLTSTAWRTSQTGGSLSTYSAEAYVFLDDVEWAASNAAPLSGNSGYETLLHEIGHALGLDHPFDGPFALPAFEDHTGNTVMSYQRQGPAKSEFQAFDLLALTWIYGGDGLAGSWGYASGRGLSLAPGAVPPGVTLTGTAGADLLNGGAGADTLSAAGGDDVLRGGGGDDRLDGGSGIDRADYAGNRGAFVLSREGGVWTVRDTGGSDGVDTLVDCERLAFADSHLALDLDGHAGQVARILGAVFGPAFLQRGDYVGVGLDLLDKGMAYDDLVRVAVGTEQFRLLTGTPVDAAIGHLDFVDRVYRNVVGVDPGREERDYFVGLLESGQYSQASLALLACDTEANAQHIDLIGLSSTGIVYAPVT